MHFLVHSSKTKQFVYAEARSSWDRVSWIDDLHKAKKYATPSHALNAMSKLSATSKPHIVLFDGINCWNVSESKA